MKTILITLFVIFSSVSFSQSPNLQYKVLKYKQEKLEERRIKIQKYYDETWDIIDEVSKKINGLSEPQKSYVDKFDSELKRVAKWDLANDENWRNIIDYINRVRKEVYSWLN